MANEVYSQSWWGNGVCDNTIDWGIDYYDEAGCSPAFTNQYSMILDGIDEGFIVARNPSFYNTSIVSISIWFKTTSVVSPYPRIYGQGFQYISLLNSNRIRWRCYETSSGTRIDDMIRTAPTTFTDGNWHHIMCVMNTTGAPTTSRQAIYYDGALVDERVPNGLAINNELAFGVGCNYIASGQYFNGSVDEVARWHDTDQSANVSAIYNGGTPTDLNTLPTQPTNWWRMGDGATWSGIDWQVPNVGIDTSTTLRSINVEQADRQTDTP